MPEEFKKCSKCGNYDFSKSHKCPPLWKIRIDIYDHEDCISEISPQVAAQKAVEKWDKDGTDYICIRGEEIEVTVTGIDGQVMEFLVVGESVPQYSARLKKAEMPK